MRKIREVLRLRYECERTHREIAASCDISPASVGEYLKRARTVGLEWSEVRELSEEQVEARLFRQVGYNEPPLRAAIDYAWLQRELPRIGVTLQLLWSEYERAAAARSEHPYRYSRFCELYASWRGKQRLSMRQVHRAGEKLFVDYSGKRPHIVDPTTGESRDVELFVAVMGASNYTFSEATLTQQLPDFVASNIRALEYFGASPEILVPDQLRSAIRGPDRYDPDINRTFLSFAQHYGLTVILRGRQSQKISRRSRPASLPTKSWHEALGDPTIADAICDRLVPQRSRPRPAWPVHAPPEGHENTNPRDSNHCLTTHPDRRCAPTR
jgi:transposase